MLHTDEDVETLIDEYGLDAVVVTLMEMAATRPISIIQYRLQRGDKRLGYILLTKFHEHNGRWWRI